MSAPVFLPRTEFPMRAQLSTREPSILELWDDLYEKLRKQSKGRPQFVVAFGPPYANGNIHMGHVLSEVLKDLLNKTYQMRGYDAPLIPGWDSHGLPIEWKVEELYRAKGRARADVPFMEFVSECRSFAKNWIEKQKASLQRLGIVADWKNPYTTMDTHSEARIVEEFYKWVEKGLIYRGLKPVLWSVVEQTALAEAEVEYKEKQSTAVHVLFPIVKPSIPALEGAHAVIWTTTPWTLPANRAIAYGPDFDYVIVKQGERRLLIAEALAATIEGTVESHLKGQDLIGTWAAHPLSAHGYKDVPMLPGEHVTQDAGTGLVHTAPSHGIEDFLVGKENGLEVPELVGPDGVYAHDVPLFAGLHIFKADQVIADAIEAAGNLLMKNTITHSYPHSWRSKAPLIYRATSQWFASMEHVRDRALQLLENVEFSPAVSRHRMQSMLRDRPDWCLSRQRWWGVPLALFLNIRTREILWDTNVNERIIACIQKHGIEGWRLTPKAEFLGADHNPDDFEAVSDILDVWFESACVQSFVMSDRGLGQTVDVYLEGTDQHRAWFQTSLLHGCAVYDSAPYHHLITHGFVLNDTGDKMSKSGKSLTPESILDTHGADVLRLWVAMSHTEEDVRLSNDILEQQNDIYRRFRNTLRYLMGALDGWQESETIELSQMPTLEQFVLHRLFELHSLHQTCTTPSTLTHFYQELHTFCANELSALFFDIRKDSLYCDAPTNTKRRSARTVMHHTWHMLVRWLAPVLSFTAEEAWKNQGQIGSIHEQLFITPPDTWHQPQLGERVEHLRAMRREITTAIESARTSKLVGSSLQAGITVTLNENEEQQWQGEDVAEWSITSSASLKRGMAFSVEVHQADGTKCERCWKILPEVNQTSAFLCQRCKNV